MAVKTEEKVRSVIARVGEEICEKALTIGRDLKAERRKRVAWGGLQGSLGAVVTLGARRVVANLWGVLTGERPPSER